VHELGGDKPDCGDGRGGQLGRHAKQLLDRVLWHHHPSTEANMGQLASGHVLVGVGAGDAEQSCRLGHADDQRVPFDVRHRDSPGPLPSNKCDGPRDARFRALK
jgi:hypothetical protein